MTGLKPPESRMMATWKRTCWVGLLGLFSLPVGAEGLIIPPNPRYAEVVRFLRAAGRSPYIMVGSIGRSAEGRAIPAAIVHDPTVPWGRTYRCLLLARQHGNEPAGTVAQLYLLRLVAAGPNEALRQRLQHWTLLLVPLVNPDGAERDQRRNARNVDLNRDWTTRTQSETRAVERFFLTWRPQVVIDQHELPPRDRQGLNTVETPSLVSSANRRLAIACNNAQFLALQRLREWGYPVRPSYFNDDLSETLCHRHFLFDHSVPAFLFESERGNGRTPLLRRVGMHLIALFAVLDYFTPYPRRRTHPPQAQPVLNPVDSTPSLATRLARRVRQTSRFALGSTRRPQRAPARLQVLGIRPGEVVSGQVQVQVRITGVSRMGYLILRLDGKFRALSNIPPYRYIWNTTEAPPGPHTLLVEAYDADEQLVARKAIEVTVAPRAEGPE
ncbi:MAG TPA: DUF2817 domain-containing protein [Armatimonadetes bacterium]|nr:DUF2817 domain-containing protein [Armatimonadota bacterium]